MNKSSHYLQEMERQLQDFAQQVASLDDADPNLLEKIVAILHEAEQFEKNSRETSDVGVRFSVLVSQLQDLLKEGEQELATVSGLSAEKPEAVKPEVAEDQQEVFIYLFNAQGHKLTTWKSLLAPNALIDHSVNRPAYASRAYIEELMRSKEGARQHGFLRAVIKKADIVMSEDKSIFKDKLGHPLIRIQHAALKPEMLKEFYVGGKLYKIARDGSLTFKENLPL